MATPAPGASAVARTDWAGIALAIFSALIAAFQIGKAIIALPLLQQAPLYLSLRQSGMVLSALAIVGALLAMPLGLLIARFEPRKVLCAGLLTIAVSSGLGSLAGNVGVLIASRVVEGIAVIMLLVCASSAVGRLATAHDRDLAMALSSTAVPGGIALVILVTTLAAAADHPLSWPLLWQINAVLAIAAALIVLCWMPRLAPAAAPGTASPAAAIGQVARSSGPRKVALGFSLYAIVYFALSGFLPLLLRDLLGLGPIAAGLVSAAIIAANVLGNITAGALMRRGVTATPIVATGFLIAAACVPVLFWLHVPVLMAAVVAAVMIGGMGGIPAALTAMAPKVAPSPALVSPTIGLMMQGSYVGQLIGPTTAGVLAQLGGWSLVAWLLLPLALGGVLLSRRL